MLRLVTWEAYGFYSACKPKDDAFICTDRSCLFIVPGTGFLGSAAIRAQVPDSWLSRLLLCVPAALRSWQV